MLEISSSSGNKPRLMIGVHRAVVHGRLSKPISVAYRCGELRGGNRGAYPAHYLFPLNGQISYAPARARVELYSGDSGRGRGIRMTMISDDVDFRWSHRMSTIRPICLAHRSLHATVHAPRTVLESYYIVHSYAVAQYITRTVYPPPSSHNSTSFHLLQPPILSMPTHLCIVPFIPVHS
jgi:hypothetical protein